MTNKQRPVYLSLTQFRWPLPAMASITHRITGVMLFVGVAYLLWLLDLALQSEAGFAAAAATLALPLPKLVLWGVLVVLLYHLIAGVKHLLLDFHIGDTMEAAQAGVWTVFAITAVLAALLGVWIW
ncbi:MAG: succinate dehydrogenase, cytochrome b556 subunit [Pseudomonadales bacterium]